MSGIIVTASIICMGFSLVMLFLSKKTAEIAEYLLSVLIFTAISFLFSRPGAHTAALLLLLFSDGAVIFIFLIKISRKLK